MSLAAPLHKLSLWLKPRPTPRARGRGRAQEPADLGTELGMECWLDQSQPMPLSSHSAATPARRSAWWPLGPRREG